MNTCIEERRLAYRPELRIQLEPRIQVEQLFARTGRTYRRGAARIWYKRRIEPQILKFGLQAAGLYRRGLRNALDPVVRTLRLRFANLPAAFDGFQLLHVSDFHIDGNAALADRVCSLLSGLNPDLCVFTGDYRFDVMGRSDCVYAPMRQIVESISAKHGIFGVLGNHDVSDIAFGLEEMGVRMLVNEAAPVREGNDCVWIAGIDDPFDYRCDDLPSALADAPANAFQILLAHTPDRIKQAARRGVNLYLCGHTHAGQIRLPVIGSIKHNSKTSRKFSFGHWDYEGMQGYTTAGIGCSALPVRYNCRPELVMIELLAA
jgi:uncharacterized protein